MNTKNGRRNPENRPSTEEKAKRYDTLMRRHKYLIMRLEQDGEFTPKERKRWLESFETPDIYGYFVEKTKKGYSIVSRSRQVSVGPFNFPQLREVISYYQGVASVVADGERHLENLETKAGAD